MDILDKNSKVFAIVNQSNFIGGYNIMDEVKRNISEIELTITKEDGGVYKTDKKCLFAFELVEEKISGF